MSKNLETISDHYRENSIMPLMHQTIAVVNLILTSIFASIVTSIPHTIEEIITKYV